MEWLEVSGLWLEWWVVGDWGIASWVFVFASWVSIFVLGRSYGCGISDNMRFVLLFPYMKHDGGVCVRRFILLECVALDDLGSEG